MHEGRWLDASNDSTSSLSFQNWQPPGCMLHRYNSKDISTCLHSRKIILAGDSTIRQIFWAIARKLDPNGVTETLTEDHQHADLRINRKNVDLHFVWDPFLNTTRLHHELLLYQIRDATTGDNHDLEKQVARIILTGSGLWHARHFKDDPVSQYVDTIRNITAYLRSPYQLDTSTQRPLQPAPAEDLLLIAPVQLPLYESLSLERAGTITPARIDPMNVHLQEIAVSRKADVLWSFNSMSSQQKLTYQASGIHVVERVASQKADVLLNLGCNSKFTAIGRYPFDRTCCSRYSPSNRVQQFLLFCGMILLPLLSFALGKGGLRRF